MVPYLRAAALAATLALAAPAAASADTAPQPPSPAAPSPAAPSPAAPAAPAGWVAVLWQPVADWTAWLMHWAAAEERVVAADVDRFARRLVTDADAFERLVEEAGFSVNEIGVGLGPLPEITLDLDFERRLAPEERAALLARVQAAEGLWGALERGLVDIMLAAADTEYAAERDSGYRLTGLEIEADLIPRATLILGPRETRRTAALD